MADRVYAAVSRAPRRRARLGAIVLAALAVMVFTGVFAAAPLARTVRQGRTTHHGVRVHSRRHSVAHVTQKEAYAYATSELPKLTVAEKFGQLTMAGPTTLLSTLEQQACQGLVGSVLDLTGVANIHAVQDAATAPGCHPGIPLIFSLDVIHGYKTMFPAPIGEASSWDPSLVQNDESVSALEASSDGLKWTFNPMVDISRDPRWGRVVEGAGEDPYLGSAIAAAKVTGYQGSDFSAADRMAATIKHFGAYGAPVAGREYNTVDMSTQQLFNDYLPPYKAAVDAGAATVMSSFNSLNGVPNTANPYLLTKVLRNMWGFNGTVVSDYQAVQELESPGFGYANGPAQAAQKALNAGLDIEMAVQVDCNANPIESTFDCTGPQQVGHGISMTQLNNAVLHVLELKYLAGMIANPDPGSTTAVANNTLTQSNLNAAKASADESQVLLENHNGALPLSKTLSSIAVIGPLANAPMDQLGPDVPIGYDANAASHIVTVLDGIKADDPGATVNYQQGCDPDTTGTNGYPPEPCNSTAGFPAAVAAAQGAQETVVVLGEPSADSGEASSRTHINLPGDELQLVQEIAATTQHYVVVLMNGRPLTIPWLQANAPALLESWYPGTEGGKSVADILFGNVNPSGKLPMSFPYDTGQIPVSYNELPTGRPYDPNNKYTSRYLDAPNEPLYPFGYGLSYSTFTVGAPTLSSASIGTSGTETVTATVTNTGTTTGTDVAQLYIHEDYRSIVQPVEKLEGSQRVTLKAGQSKTVRFKLTSQNLGFYNNHAQFVVEPGPVDVWVGDSSLADDGTPVTFNIN